MFCLGFGFGFGLGFRNWFSVMARVRIAFGVVIGIWVCVLVGV